MASNIISNIDIVRTSNALLYGSLSFVHCLSYMSISTRLLKL